MSFLLSKSIRSFIILFSHSRTWNFAYI